MLIRSRRDFLRDAIRSVSAAGALGVLSKFGEMNALAAGPGYQALVCIFLSGGNDGHNTVVPIATAQQSYAPYQSARGALAIPQASLLPIVNGSDVYGLHPSLPEIQGLYKSGNAAVLANMLHILSRCHKSILPTISVQAALPGASPETMATSPAAPLERQFSHIAGVTQMTSPSNLGATSITLQLDLNRNIDGAARDIQAAINAAQTYLPANLPSHPTYCTAQSG